MTYLFVMVVTFVNIFLRATQQRHVMHAQLLRMPAVSFGMALCEVFVWGTVAKAATGGSNSHLLAVACAMGVGGSVGSMLATWLHVRKHG